MTTTHDEQVEQMEEEARAEVRAESRAAFAPRERPILFSGAMVRAILEGRKTQTRRVVRPQPVEWSPGRWSWPAPFTTERPYKWTHAWDAGHEPDTLAPCPCGQPGDRLWVRETWRTSKSLNALSPAEIEAIARINGCEHGPFAPVRYEVDGRSLTVDIPEGGWGKTRVSIHMPRWASRFTLEVTEVRVQRLQEISEEDARAEGIPSDAKGWEWLGILPPPPAERGGPIAGWQWLWNSINGERPGCSWEANPWAWCVSFRRLP